MKEMHSTEQEIITALMRAEKQGQPIAELFEAVAQGAELDAWFEETDNGNDVLVITVRE